MPGQSAEFLNSRFDVVTCPLFSLLNRGEINRVNDLFVVVQGALGNVDPETLLGVQYSEPELSFQYDLVFRGPEGPHG